MQSNSVFEFGAECLGAVGMTAAWRREKPDVANRGRWSPMVVIQECSTMDEGAFQPAASVTVSGKGALLALRAAVDEALKHEV